MIGMIVGLMIGLALALGVALYVTKAPNPFVTKVPPRTAVQDAAEVERNRNWDPNGPLAGRNPMPTPAPAPAGSAPPSAPNMAAAPPSTAASGRTDAHREGGAGRERTGRTGPVHRNRRRSVHLFRAGRRVCASGRCRAAAREARDARHRKPLDRARAGRSDGVPGPRRPVRAKGRCRHGEGEARRSRRRFGAGAGAEVIACRTGPFFF